MQSVHFLNFHLSTRFHMVTFAARGHLSWFSSVGSAGLVQLVGFIIRAHSHTHTRTHAHTVCASVCDIGARAHAKSAQIHTARHLPEAPGWHSDIGLRRQVRPGVWRGNHRQSDLSALPDRHADTDAKARRRKDTQTQRHADESPFPDRRADAKTRRHAPTGMRQRVCGSAGTRAARA